MTMAQKPPKSMAVDWRSSWVDTSMLVGFFFAVWLAPRWTTVLENPLTYDDFAHTYVAHLGTGRPLLALEGWIGDQLFGGDYMASRAPMLLSGLWLSITAALLTRWVAALGSPVGLAAMALAAWLLHPAINELSLWKVCSGANLSLLLVVGGSIGLISWELRSSRIISAFLVLIGMLGYQVFVMVPLTLTLVYLVAKALDNATMRQVVIRAAGVTIAAILAVLVVKWGTAIFFDIYHDTRGFVSTSRISEAFVVAQMKNMSNILANLSQPSLGLLFGVHTAWSLIWSWPYLIMMLLGTVVALSTREAAIWIRFLILTGPVLLPVLVSLIWVAIDPAQSNLRVCVPSVLAVCLFLPAIVARADANSRVRLPIWGVASVLIIAFGLVQGATTAVDARMRNAAYQDVLKVQKAAWLLIEESGLVIADVGFTSALEERPESKPFSNEHLLVVSFQPVTQDSYMPFRFWFFWKGFAERSGFRSVICEKNGMNTGCALNDVCENAGMARDVNGTSLRLVLDAHRKLITLCEKKA